jgi:hypothetical protein
MSRLPIISAKEFEKIPGKASKRLAMCSTNIPMEDILHFPIILEET